LQVNRKDIFGLIAARSVLQKHEIPNMYLKAAAAGGIRSRQKKSVFEKN